MTTPTVLAEVPTTPADAPAESAEGPANRAATPAAAAEVPASSAATPTAAALPEIAADLVLVRLLAPSKKPQSPSRVRADLGKFLRERPSTATFEDLAARLRTQGLLEKDGLRLTEAGRRRALTFLGVEELTGRINWGTIQARYLVPRALGLKPDSDEVRQKIGDHGKLAALLLKRELKLPTGTGATLNQVLEVLACRKLGFPEETTLEAVRDAALNRLLGEGERLNRDQLVQQLPRKLLGANRGVAELAEGKWSSTSRAGTDSVRNRGVRDGP
jgi:hypothetical protein